jgi:phosphate transport system substrate-binding protein
MKKLWLYLILSSGLGFLGQQAMAVETIRYGGATTLQKSYMPKASKLFSQEKDVKFVIQGGNTTSGMILLLKNRLDIAGGGRWLSEAEKQQGLVEVQVGWDALIPIVNAVNPVTDLTLAQLRDIFAGKLTNWKDLGGNDEKILLYIAPQKSGIRTAQQQLILKNQPFSTTALETPRVPSNAINIIANKTGGIGVISKGLIVSNPNDAVKTLTVDGISPTPLTIQNKQYQLVKPLILATKGEAQGLVKEFIDFTLSEAGKTIMNESFFTLE